MTEQGNEGTKRRRHGGTRKSCASPFATVIACAFALFSAGCGNPPRNDNAIRSYYDYQFTEAREALRKDTYGNENGQTILNNTRLGMASLADGDTHEAERALGKSFDLLSTAGLNKDKTVAAVLDHESVKIWKGEPFEQALTYYEVSALYAVMGDWENARAAAANALFRLTDFGADQNAELMAKSAAKDPEYLQQYTAVDTNFALGFIMQGIGAQLSGGAGSDDLFDAAVKINGDLQPLTDKIRQRTFNTLLIVDYGKGPTKIAYGPDEALVRFEPQDRDPGPLIVTINDTEVVRQNVVCDVNQMAVDHRWNNLEDVRKAKSAIGTALLYGGAITTGVGANNNNGAVALAGIGAMALGLLTKAGAKGDTRYCEFMPASVYVAPINLDKPRDLHVSIAGDPRSNVVLHAVTPGTDKSPRAIYLRILGPGSPQPEWLIRARPIYGNDAIGVGQNDFPYILGGHDVCSPTQEVLEAYQRHGYLQGATLSDLREMYDAEDIHVGDAEARHILEGGDALFTPEANSMGYKRLMFGKHERYQPKSDLVRNAAELVRVESQGLGNRE